MNDVQKLLRIVRGEDTPEVVVEPDDPPVTDEQVASAVVTRLAGERMKPREQAAAAMRFSVERARSGSTDLARREGSVVHGLMNAKPPSVAEQAEYAASRAWVPPGHAGGWAERSGVAYHALIGRPGVALGNTISALCARPLRFAIAAFLLATLILITFVLLG